MALTTLEKLTAWAHPNLDGARDDEVERCIDAASAWVEGVTRRVIEQAEQTLYFNGDDAYQSGASGVIEIPKRYSPVIHAGATLIVVTEDSSTLTVAVGYDTSAGVIIEGANERTLICRLLRQGSAWSRGLQNIKVVFTAGYTTIPAEIEQLANEISWLMFKSPNWIGVAAESAAGHSKSFEKELTPQSAALVRAMIEERW